MFVTDLKGLGEVCGLTVEQLLVVELRMKAEMEAMKVVEEPVEECVVVDPAALVEPHVSAQWLAPAQLVTVDMFVQSARSFRTDVALDAVFYEIVGGEVRLYCLDSGEGAPITGLLSDAFVAEHGFRRFVRGEVQLPSRLYDDGLRREFGYCYLALFDVRYRVFMKQQLGIYPSASIVASALLNLPGEALASGRIVLHEDVDSFHVCSFQEGCKTACRVGSVYNVRKQRDLLIAVLRCKVSSVVGGIYSRCCNRGVGYLASPRCAACLQARSAGLPVVAPVRYGCDDAVLNLAEIHSAVRIMTVMQRDVNTVVGMCRVIDGTVDPWLFPEGAPADAVTQVPFDSEGVVKVYAIHCLQAVLPVGCVYDVGGVLVSALENPVVVVGFSGLMVRVVSGVPSAPRIVVRTRGERSKVRMMHQMFGLDPSDVFFRLCQKLDVEVALLGLSRADRLSVGTARDAHCVSGGETDGWAGYSTELCSLPGVVDIGLHGTVVRARDDYVDVGCVRLPVGSSIAIPVMVREVVLDGFSASGPILFVGDDEYSLDGGGPSNSDGEFDDEV